MNNILWVTKVWGNLPCEAPEENCRTFADFHIEIRGMGGYLVGLPNHFNVCGIHFPILSKKALS